MRFIESYFFYPNFWQKILSIALLPISFFYFIIAFFLKFAGKKKNFNVKIISIGNLVSGGSGKTPFCITLSKYLESKNYTDIFIIMRGYKRASSGLKLVRDATSIRCDVADSGDEAMLIAMSVNACVIVAESRTEAINYAKSKGAKIIILDDGYRFRFVKFDILLRPAMRPFFDFTLPSGYYRLPPFFYKKCDLLLDENADYKRIVNVEFMKSSTDSIQNDTKVTDSITFILATAIANPSRLESYTQNLRIAHKFFLNDHDTFDMEMLKKMLKKYNANYILMTSKDYVKCVDFSLPIAVLRLEMKIDSIALQKIIKFLKS